MPQHPMRKGTTARALAKRLNVNIKTVFKYTAIPRAEYEANSITRAQPWVELGISRATWYNHGKPTARISSLENPTGNGVQQV